MSERFSSPRLKATRTNFKRKTWKDRIHDLLGEDLQGFVESGGDVEVVTKRDLSPQEREAIKRILERAEDG